MAKDQRSSKDEKSELRMLTEFVVDSSDNAVARQRMLASHSAHVLFAGAALSAITLLVGSGVIFCGDGWVCIVLGALCLGVLCLSAGAAVVAIVANMKLRSITGLVGWNPGGLLESMSARGDRLGAVRRCLEEQRMLLKKDNEAVDSAGRLLVIADGLLMGAMLVGLVAVIMGFVVGIVAAMGAVEY